MDSPEEKRVCLVSNDDKLPIDLNSNGQLLGQYTKLDEQLWLNSSQNNNNNNNNEAMKFCSEGQQWTIVPSNPTEPVTDPPSSEPADNLLTDGGVTSLESNISSSNDSLRSQSRTFSPISVLRRKSFETFAMKRARTNHRRRSGKERSRFRLSDPKNFKQSFAVDDTTDSLQDGVLRTRKITDLLQLHPVEKDSNPDPNPNPNPTQQMELVKKCVRCDSASTPQWRDGPTGRKTLCNACGLQFKKAFPSHIYRPLKTLSPQTEVAKKCVQCETGTTPQWRDGPEGSKTLCNACGIQYKKGRPMRTPGFDYSQYKKRVPKMTRIEKSAVDDSSAGEAKTPLEMIAELAGVVKKCVHCETTTTPQWRNGPEGLKTLCNACGMQYKKGRPMRTPGFDSRQKKKKVQKMTPVENSEVDKSVSDSDPTLLSDVYRPLNILKPETQVVKKCVHCETTSTPQWRDGPEGLKTLCNACGIQYKKGRPLRSPGSDSHQYKKRVQEMIRIESSELDRSDAIEAQKKPDDFIGETSGKRGLETVLKLKMQVVKKCAHCETETTPQWRKGPEGLKTLCNACGMQYKKGRPMRPPGFDSHQNKKKFHEMIRVENSELGSDSDSTVLSDVFPLSIIKPETQVFKKCLHCETVATPQWRDGPDGLKTLCNACGIQYKKGRPMRSPGSDSHQYNKKVEQMITIENIDMIGESSVMHRLDSDSDFEFKKCSHCETTDTPQWREGPLGRKTLCNACGVQYRHGRLYPEYRPLQSPTYDPSLHSHLPKKVELMRKRKFSEERTTTSENTSLQAVKEEP